MFIYTISCPITKYVVYVGKTHDFKGRRQSHLTSNCDTNISKWIRKQTIHPIIEIIDVVPDEEWKYWEYFYADLMRQWGFKLLNMQNIGAHRNNKNHTLLALIERGLKIKFEQFCEICDIDYLSYYNTLTMQSNFTFEQSITIQNGINYVKNNPGIRNN